MDKRIYSTVKNFVKDFAILRRSTKKNLVAVKKSEHSVFSTVTTFPVSSGPIFFMLFGVSVYVSCNITSPILHVPLTDPMEVFQGSDQVKCFLLRVTKLKTWFL